jgi:hypothetical protein
MRPRVMIVPCVIAVVCTAVVAFGWYQDRPRHFVVQGGTLRTGEYSKPNPTAPIISHCATLQSADCVLQVEAYVRDVRGATIRCTLPDRPGEGGTITFTGRYGTNAVMWKSIRIDRPTWFRCLLGLQPAPRYVLDYQLPRSDHWDEVSALALIVGAILAAVWATAKLLRAAAKGRRGFDVLPAEARGPGTGQQ